MVLVLQFQLVLVDIFRCGVQLYCGCWAEIATMGIGWRMIFLSNYSENNQKSLKWKGSTLGWSVG